MLLSSTSLYGNESFTPQRMDFKPATHMAGESQPLVVRIPDGQMFSP